MQTVTLVYPGGSRDITGMVQRITWSGSTEEVARKCDIAYVNAPYDPIVSSLPAPRLGNYISVSDSDYGELFSGRVYGIEKSSSYGTVTANCIEDIQYLLKSKGKYSFANTTAEEITAQICADYEFPTGELASTGVEIKTLVCNGEVLMDIIKKAYAQASKENGKKYMFIQRGRSLCVVEKGSTASTYTVSDSTNITESHYTEKTESIVNKVVIYDKTGERIGEVSDGGSLDQYGTFQDIYTEEEGVDPYSAAQNMLTTPDQSLSITALGDCGCTAGNAIKLHDAATGMYGLYWVKNDTHTFENGIHSMQLEIEFKEVSSE